MSYRAWLPARALPGQRAALARAFIERGVLEECRATVPGFVRGELLLSDSDPDLVCVTVEWTDRQAFLDWQASPVRAAQGPALMQWLSAVAASELFRTEHAIGRDVGR